MSRLDEILNAVDIRAELAEETQTRSESQGPSFAPIVQESGDFHETEEVKEPIQTPTDPPPAPIEEAKPLEPYDALKNARSLVYGIQSIEGIVLTPIAVAKARKNMGGGTVIKSMRDAYQKKMRGEKLDETEQNLVAALADYERKMALLSDDILPTQEETNKLIQAAVPYCEETQMNIKAGLGFWGAYFGSMVGKIGKMLMS